MNKMVTAVVQVAMGRAVFTLAPAVTRPEAPLGGWTIPSPTHSQ
jgi:hypothetical protein